MPLYDCKLVTDQGQVTERVIEAESKIHVFERAEARNELVLSVKEHKESFNLNAWLNKRKKVKPEELEHFTSQLSVMLKAGVPLIGCLQALTEQTESPTMEKIVQELVDRVNSGSSFSQALATFPRVFGTLFVSMVAAGETAGILDELLERLQNFIRHDMEVTRNIKSAMRYPIIVMVALSLAFTAAITFILPKFTPMFKSYNIDLPLPTKILMAVSDFMNNYWMAGLIGLVVLVLSLRYYVKTPIGAYQFDYFKLKVPVFKEIVLKSTISRFVHMLETLTRGGIHVIKALQTTSKTVGNLVFTKAIEDVSEKVAEGITLADALAQHKFFPKMTIKMISVGEQSGALEDMLANIAYQFDAEVDAKIKRLSTAIEPMITVVMGLFVVVIALGILLPMWKMYSAFK